jgi:hypothetical protein
MDFVADRHVASVPDPQTAQRLRFLHRHGVIG